MEVKMTKDKPRHYPPAYYRYKENNPQVSFRIKLSEKETIKRLIGEVKGISVNNWCKERILEILAKGEEKRDIKRDIEEYVRNNENYEYSHKDLMAHLREQGVNVNEREVSALEIGIRGDIAKIEKGMWCNIREKVGEEIVEKYIFEREEG